MERGLKQCTQEWQTLALVVQKFGGSSISTAEKIMRAARRAIRAQQDGNQVIVVVSARGDTTDELIALAREISDHPPAREMDMLLATGEQISIALMAMAIQTLGQPAISFTGAQIGIVTDSFHTKARIKNISTARIRQALDEGKIVIVAGFQGIDESYNITTLGRGGSDTTAVALAAVMKHSESEVRGQKSEVGSQRSASKAEDCDPSPLAPRPSPLAPTSEISANNYSVSATRSAPCSCRIPSRSSPSTSRRRIGVLATRRGWLGTNVSNSRRRLAT
jgi:hypothetical protein